MHSTRSGRLLALAPGCQHLGYAVFDGEELVRFGIRTFPGKKTRDSVFQGVRQFLEKLFAVHGPAVIVIEEPFYAQARLSPLLRAQMDAAKRWAARKRLRLIRYLPTTPKERFCAEKPSRRNLALAMALRYPFLAPYLKPTHGQRARNYWQQMFEAVAMGSLAVSAPANRGQARQVR